METMIGLYRIAPLPDVSDEKFQRFVEGEVFPLVDTRPTRGGQIKRLALFKQNDGQRGDRYLWLIEWTTFGGSWAEGRIAEALDKLKTVGIPVSFFTFEQVSIPLKHGSIQD